METNGYSIWVEPEDEIKSRLSKVIKSLSERYSTPFFDPHVTVIGGIGESELEMTYLTKSLSGSVEPYFIQLTGQLGCEEDWARALFIGVKETDKIQEVNKLAKRIFPHRVNNPYHPHLSLMYTDKLSLQEKLTIASSLSSKNFRDRFLVNQFYLYRTEGVISAWQKVAEFELRGR